jgi:hypothetical protein
MAHNGRVGPENEGDELSASVEEVRVPLIPLADDGPDRPDDAESLTDSEEDCVPVVSASDPDPPVGVEPEVSVPEPASGLAAATPAPEPVPAGAVPPPGSARKPESGEFGDAGLATDEPPPGGSKPAVGRPPPAAAPPTGPGMLAALDPDPRAAPPGWVDGEDNGPPDARGRAGPS